MTSFTFPEKYTGVHQVENRRCRVFLDPSTQWLLNQTQSSHQLCDLGYYLTSVRLDFFIFETKIIITFS
jgi:hypothetical protein